MRTLLTSVLVLLVAGCASHPMRPSAMPGPSEHRLMRPYIPDINESGLFHLSCTDRYPNGRSVYEAFDRDTADPSRVELAKRHFIHAAMANNAYANPAKKPVFALPGWHLLEALESDTDLALQVYGDAPRMEDSKAIVVAYRGTESLVDWGNNFALKDPPQYKQAYQHMKALRERFPAAKVTAVGHSLGGGIAMNMSMRVEGVDAVAFNMSPRIRFGKTKPYPAYRASIFEVGEILTGLTKGYSAVLLPGPVSYGNYNFLDYRTLPFSPLPEHGIYELTRGLTVVAMTRGSVEAQEFFKANIGEAKARQVDWEHCQALFEGGTTQAAQ